MPFFTALLAYLIFKRKNSLNVWVSIFIATVGIVIMAFGNTEKNSLLGFVLVLRLQLVFQFFQ